MPKPFYIPKKFCTSRDTTATANQQQRPRTMGFIPLDKSFFRFVLSPMADMAITIINFPALVRYEDSHPRPAG